LDIGDSSRAVRLGRFQMFVVLNLMAHLICAAPSGGMDVPAPSWEGSSHAQSSLDLDGPSQATGEDTATVAGIGCPAPVSS